MAPDVFQNFAQAGGVCVCPDKVSPGGQEKELSCKNSQLHTTYHAHPHSITSPHHHVLSNYISTSGHRTSPMRPYKAFPACSDQSEHSRDLVYKSRAHL